MRVRVRVRVGISDSGRKGRAGFEKKGRVLKGSLHLSQFLRGR